MYFIGGVEKTNSDKSVCKGFANHKAKTVVSALRKAVSGVTEKNSQESRGGDPALLSGAAWPRGAT